jgi:periplasmic copper chaperone A
MPASVTSCEDALMRKHLVVAAALVAATSARAGQDEDAVKTVLMTAFDKPETRLVVDPIVVSGTYAIADWTQGAHGGRALLRQGAKGWALILCAGDGLKDPQALKLAGLAAAEASDLTARLAASEQSLPGERLALLSSLEGIVRMDDPAPGSAAAEPPRGLSQQDITVSSAWSRATPGGADVGAGYFTVTNSGREPDRLLSASSDAAESIEIHEMSTRDGIMIMRQIEDGLPIAPGQAVAFTPGGYHLMLTGLRTPLVEGTSVTVILQFARAGRMAVRVDVLGVGAQGAGGQAVTAGDADHERSVRP